MADSIGLIQRWKNIMIFEVDKFSFLFFLFHRWSRPYWVQSPWSSNLPFSHARGLCFPKILSAYSNCPPNMCLIYFYETSYFPLESFISYRNFNLEHWPVPPTDSSVSSLWCLTGASDHFPKFMVSCWPIFPSSVLHHRNWPIHLVFDHTYANDSPFSLVTFNVPVLIPPYFLNISFIFLVQV